MSEAPSSSALDETQEPREAIIPAADVPEHYVRRLEKAKSGRMAGLITAMGVKHDGQRTQLSVTGTKERLERLGLTPWFDLTPVEGVVGLEDYLKLISARKGPVGFANPGTTLHDYVFHGVGLETMDEPVGKVASNAASRALLSRNPSVIANCVGTIDSLSGSYFAMELEEFPPERLEVDIAGRLSELAVVLGTSLPGDSMFESTQAQNQERILKEQSSAMAKASVAHYYQVLDELNAQAAVAGSTPPA